MRQARFLSSVVLVVMTLVAPRLAGAAGAPPDSVLGVRCADIYLLGIDRQQNLRAGLIRVGCGLEFFGSAMGESGENPGGFSVEDYGGVDIDVSGPDPNPFAVHSTSMVWGNDATVVVTYNDSAEAPDNYSGVSVSLDGGATFIRLRPSPFATGHGENYGYPVVVWNAALQQWFAGFLVTGCGAFGIGLWSSVDALNWRPGVCAHAGTFDDRESMWALLTPTTVSAGARQCGSRRLSSSETFSSAGVQLMGPWSSPGWTSTVAARPERTGATCPPTAVAPGRVLRWDPIS